MRITSARKLAPVVLTLSMTLVPAMTFAGDVGAPGALLNGALDLTYVGHLEKKDGDGRLLVWEGSVGGDFAGTIRWWFADQASTKFVGGQVFYADLSDRWNWSVGLGRIPYLLGYYQFGQDQLGPFIGQTQYRIFISSVSGQVSYPFSTTQRVEMGLGIAVPAVLFAVRPLSFSTSRCS